jgi:hypothetical protein
MSLAPVIEMLDTSQAAVFSTGQKRILVMASVATIIDWTVPNAGTGKLFTSDDEGGTWQETYFTGISAMINDRTFSIEFAVVYGGVVKSFLLFSENNCAYLLEVGTEDKVKCQRTDAIDEIALWATYFLGSDELTKIQAFLDAE